MDQVDDDFFEGGFQTLGQFFTYLSMKYGTSPSIPVHIFILHPSKNVSIERIEEAADKRGLRFTYERVCKDLYKVIIRISVRSVEGYLFIQDGWWMLVSRGSGSIINDVLVKSFVKTHFFPILAPAHVPTDELVSIVTDLGSVYEEVTLDEFSMASERGSLREWLKSGDNVSKELCENLQKKYNSSFTAFRITASAKDSTPLKFRVYTESRLSFLSGSFGDFYQFVIIPFVRQSLHLLRTYDQRQRRISEGKLFIHGIRIHGKYELGDEDIKAVKEFIVRNYSTMLMHENPVIILQASDRKDGSSYDIYITQRAIDIIPLSKASSESLVSLCTAIVRRLPPFMRFEPVKPIETEI